jgi:tRNA-specific 2-thiouridylase
MNSNKNITVAIGMSGGVDSSIAAHLLQEAGFSLVGLTMQIWDGRIPLPDNGLSGCFGPGEARDITAAQTIAKRLGIPHHVVPLADEYAADILTYFRQEYCSGRTPNPCVRCNRSMKFGLLLQKARAMGIAFDRFATGHYARVEHNPTTGRQQLLRAIDHRKDQSYFLARLSQPQLAEVIFPLGNLTKETVKTLARTLNWSDLADKDESQNFIESKNYSVLFDGMESKPGPITDISGTILGQHKGIIHYTIGQRRGLGLGGTTDPYYVVRLDPCTNTIIVGQHNDLFTSRLQAGNLNWIALAQPPDTPIRVHAKIRQQHQETPATLSVAQTGPETTIHLTFDEPQMSVTPGQTVVCYENDIVLCSATIESAGV